MLIKKLYHRLHHVGRGWLHPKATPAILARKGVIAIVAWLLNLLRHDVTYPQRACSVHVARYNYIYTERNTLQSIAFAFEHCVFACTHCVATSNIDLSYGHLRKQAHQSDKRFREQCSSLNITTHYIHANTQCSNASAIDCSITVSSGH